MLITFAELSSITGLHDKVMRFKSQLEDAKFELSDAEKDLASYQDKNPDVGYRDPELKSRREYVSACKNKIESIKKQIKSALLEIKRITFLSAKKIKKSSDKVGKGFKAKTVKDLTDEELDQMTGWANMKNAEQVLSEVEDELNKIDSDTSTVVDEDNSRIVVSKQRKEDQKKADEKKIINAKYYVIVDSDGDYVDIDNDITTSLKNAQVFDDEDVATRTAKFLKKELEDDDLEVQMIPSTYNKKIPQDHITRADSDDALHLTNKKVANKKKAEESKKNAILNGNLYVIMANGDNFVSTEGRITSKLEEAQAYSNKDVAENTAKALEKKFDDAIVQSISSPNAKKKIPFDNIDTSEDSGIVNTKAARLRKEADQKAKDDEKKVKFLSGKYFGIYVWTRDGQSGWLDSDDDLTDDYGDMIFFEGPNAAKAYVRHYDGNFNGDKMSVKSIDKSVNEELTMEYLQKGHEKAQAPRFDRPKAKKGDDSIIAGRGFHDDEDDNNYVGSSYRRSYNRSTKDSSIDYNEVDDILKSLGVLDK